jgi:hypothetical protein
MCEVKRKFLKIKLDNSINAEKLENLNAKNMFLLKLG